MGLLPSGGAGGAPRIGQEAIWAVAQPHTLETRPPCTRNAGVGPGRRGRWCRGARAGLHLRVREHSVHGGGLGAAAAAGGGGRRCGEQRGGSAAAAGSKVRQGGAGSEGAGVLGFAGCVVINCRLVGKDAEAIARPDWPMRHMLGGRFCLNPHAHCILRYLTVHLHSAQRGVLAHSCCQAGTRPTGADAGPMGQAAAQPREALSPYATQNLPAHAVPVAPTCTPPDSVLQACLCVALSPSSPCRCTPPICPDCLPYPATTYPTGPARCCCTPWARVARVERRPPFEATGTRSPHCPG